jgi:hypothetical protein
MRDDSFDASERGRDDKHPQSAEMSRCICSGCGLLLLLGVFVTSGSHAQQPVSPQGSSAAQPIEQRLEPRAVDLLKATSRRLAAARSMRFTAVTSYENPSRPGPPLV